ncbi:rho GTPase-activating protein 6-like isoform X2 [Brienomyrus brachyistius]|uniref:rho GTPase-activating protein 6-like isoform X2 n=1 Tax=Brienomyrus brachyistius TaxID=42636 RepID=UPI0020B38BA5|nr:rho GTPase-activating protein 6-like isoform X2 [Brienomyrus brachyistius]
MEDSVFLEKHTSYQGDFTWNSMSGRTVCLKPVAIQSLSELERIRLQEVAFSRLHQDYDLGCQITIPKDGQKRKKSLRRKLDSLSKEKAKDRESLAQAFGIPLSQVIANDRTHKQRLDSQREGTRDVGDLVTSFLHFTTKRPVKDLSSSNSSLSSTSETPSENTSPNTPEPAPRACRRGAMSVDSITDLDNNQSRLLEALQLSLPAETSSKKEKHRDKKFSLNPIYRQVPRLVDSCCQHLEKYGLQTVGIFRVGSSKKRVRQLREEFDRGVDVLLDEEHSVHDVAALLKEFLRDMPDSLLTRELYTAFINTTLLNYEEQLGALQMLTYLLPPCNCDTLHRLLRFLSTVAAHAPDTYSKDGHEVTGNKMTSLNLATIFGPNLLHKTKSSDREFSVQSSARAEESTAIISVVQKMISSNEALFTVAPDLQNEVLMSLMDTDPDVVDYLLRRKASQWSNTDLLRSDDQYSPDETHFSSDSNKASSGDVSPYDNNSPVLAERSAPQDRGGVSDGSTNIWGAWHATLRPSHQDQQCRGSHGNLSECGSQSSGEGGDSHPGNQKQSMPRSRAATVSTEYGPHPKMAERQRQQWQSLDPVSIRLDDQLASRRTQQPLPGSGVHAAPPYRFKPANKNEGRPPPPYPGISRATVTPAPPPASLQAKSSAPPSYLHSQQRQLGHLGPQRQCPPAPLTPIDTFRSSGTEWQDWQRERWQIWQLLSSDNADTLPETLV